MVTKRSVTTRIKEHSKNQLYPRELVGVKYLDNFTIDESKILEQALINRKGGVDNLNNIINGMSLEKIRFLNFRCFNFSGVLLLYFLCLISIVKACRTKTGKKHRA